MDGDGNGFHGYRKSIPYWMVTTPHPLLSHCKKVIFSCERTHLQKQRLEGNESMFSQRLHSIYNYYKKRKKCLNCWWKEPTKYTFANCRKRHEISSSTGAFFGYLFAKKVQFSTSLFLWFLQNQTKTNNCFQDRTSQQIHMHALQAEVSHTWGCIVGFQRI